MTRQLLNCLHRRSPHRQVRAECVPQDVNSWFHVCLVRDAAHQNLNRLLREGLTFATAQHTRTAQVPRFFRATANRSVRGM